MCFVICVFLSVYVLSLKLLLQLLLLCVSMCVIITFAQQICHIITRYLGMYVYIRSHILKV